jgi:hypothetical protein
MAGLDVENVAELLPPYCNDYTRRPSGRQIMSKYSKPKEKLIGNWLDSGT